MPHDHTPVHDLIIRIDDTLRKLESLAGRLRTTSRQNLQDASDLRDRLAAAQAEIARFRRGYAGPEHTDEPSR